MKVFIVLTAVFGLALSDKPIGGYGAPPLSTYGAQPLGKYVSGGAGGALGGAGSALGGEGSGDAAAGGNGEGESPIPGVPGEDYPIYNEVPETSFSCEGQVQGGYYADPEAECQAFHICIADGEGSFLKASALCHNGTIFNQEIFTCDLWSNFNCADAEGLYSKNEELAAAREEASAALAASAASSSGATDSDASATGAAAGDGYGAPTAPLPVPVAPATGSYGAPPVAPLPSYGAALASYA
uniref:Chitin-binding type-2 domain-containing protein n=1 Tax=Lepeophtheirus salmonis TaxID=72036 RepID=A0A0K2TET6_LEPSM